MTAPEVFKKITGLVAQHGGENKVLLVCAGSINGPRVAGSVEGQCDCCGKPVVFVRGNLEKIIQQRGMLKYLTFCFECMEASMSQDYRPVVIPNPFAGKATGVGNKRVREIEKRLSETYGCDYQDPLDNN
jgi:hypothetical protein